MTIIGSIIAGAILGALARLVMKGDQNMGVLITIVLGILGALAGYWIAGLFGVAATSGFDWLRWFISLVLSVVFIAGYLAVRGRAGKRRV